MTKLEDNILLYHGSDCVVQKPDLSKCKRHKDFGTGFYLSFEKKQAEKFANRVMKINGSKTKFINIFKLSKFDNLKILYFENADEKWFKFVCENRGSDSKESKDGFDIIIGKIADDATATVINTFLSDGYGDKKSKNAIKTALNLLLPNRLNDQICFKTEKALKQLDFISYEELEDE